MTDFELQEFALVLLSQVFLIVGTLAIITMFLMMEPAFYPIEVVWVIVFVASALATFLLVMVWKLALGVKIIRNPFGHLLSEATAASPGNRIHRLANELWKNENRKPIEVFLSDAIPNVYSVGSPRGRTVMVFSRQFVETLDDEELKAILMHEYYHIREDLKEQSNVVIEETLIVEPVPLGKIIGGLAFFFLTAVVLLLFARGSLAVAPMVYDFLKGFLIVTVFIGCALIVFFVRFLRKKWEYTGNVPVEEFLYTRELFADAFSALTTGRPEKLRSALTKCKNSARKWLLARVSARRRVIQVGFAWPFEEPQTSASNTLKSIFQTESQGLAKGLFEALRDFVTLGSGPKMNTYCPTKTRLLLIQKLETLICEHTSVAMDNKAITSKVSFPSSMHRHVRTFLKRNQAIFGAFLSYIKKNSDQFNLKECSSAIGVTDFESFLLFIGSIEMGLVEPRDL